MYGLGDKRHKKEQISDAFCEVFTAQTQEAGLFLAAYKRRMQIPWSPEHAGGSPQVNALEVAIERYCASEPSSWNSEVLKPSVLEEHVVHEFKWALREVLERLSRGKMLFERFVEKRDAMGHTTVDALLHAFRVYVQEWDHLSPDPW